MKKQSIIVDYVMEDNIVGAHTHGLKDISFNKLELEVLLPITDALMLTYIDAILNDNRVISENVDGKTLLIERLGSVRFKKMKPCFGSGIKDEEVLRVIIPDENYNYPEDEGCDAVYKFQGTTTTLTLDHNKEFKKIHDDTCKKKRNSNSFF